MIRPLDPKLLEAIISDDKGHRFWMLNSAKMFLNEDRNLASGLRALLQTYPDFLSAMYQHQIPMDDDAKGAKNWHIEFREPPFSDLLLHSTSIEGVADVYVKNKLFLSFRIFDHPRNQQALLQWLWEYGDQCEIARSIPQLDPQKLNAVFGNSECSCRGLLKDDTSVYATEGHAQTKSLGQELLCLFNFFDDVFKPRIKLDKSAKGEHETAWQKWDIKFQKSPFRSLRVQPGVREGTVDVFGFDKLVKSFQMSDGLQNGKALIDCIWNYGNKRHIAKAEYEASHSRSKTAIKPRSKLQRNSKPLLHQVLRTAGFKNQRESLMPAKQLDYISEEADVLNNTATTVKLVQRQPLVPADPNMQAGKGSLLKDQKDV